MFLQTIRRLALLAGGILSLLVIVKGQDIKPVDPTVRKPLEEAESTYDREENTRRAKPCARKSKGFGGSCNVRRAARCPQWVAAAE
jgi:hypothetical protein